MVDINSNLVLILLPLAILLDLALSAVKTGFINSRVSSLLMLNDQAELETGETLRLLNRPNQLFLGLKTCHIVLRFLVAVLAVVLLLPPANSTFPYLAAVGVLLVTAMLLSFLEQYVQSRVRADPELWAIRFTPFTRVLLILFSPILAIPWVLSRTLFSEPQDQSSVTEDELNIILDASEKEGVLEIDERKMIKSIFQLRDTLAREIMIPRLDLLALNINTPITVAMDAMLESGFSRVPVFEETIDRIVGVMYVKDLLRLCRDGEQEGLLHDKVRPAYFVPETKKVDELLSEMQNRRIHIAMVVDEYGGVAGLVTLEDIVEELLGEIQDEYDHGEEEPYLEVEDGVYVFLGRIDLNEFNEIMESDFSKDDADTLGGLMYSRFGRIPKAGESISEDDILLTIEQVTGRRIRKVRAKRGHRSPIEPGENIEE